MVALEGDPTEGLKTVQYKVTGFNNIIIHVYNNP